MTLNSAWLHTPMQYMCITHEGTQCDKHINAGLWIGWSSVVRELFEEANQWIYVLWDKDESRKREKHRGTESSPKCKGTSGLCITDIPPPPTFFLSPFYSRCLCSLSTARSLTYTEGWGWVGWGDHKEGGQGRGKKSRVWLDLVWQGHEASGKVVCEQSDAAEGNGKTVR